MNCFRGRKNETSDNRWYSRVIRTFALTLFIISPAAFRYVRDKFNKTLPCPSTFRKWYAESNLKCSPGILIEAMKTLKGMVDEANQTGRKIFVSLSFDEMAIRRHVQWLHEKKVWSGYIHVGKCLQNNKLPIASNVLVFMATILESNVSIPVAYYPIISLDSNEKREVLMEVVKELTKIGVGITNIVFDGLQTNFSMVHALGCSFSSENFKTFFVNPYNNSKIYVLLDACHMLKLIRNALGDLKSITDPIHGKIQWLFFERLEKFRTVSKFVTHRFNKRHIQYFRNRMNVRLATQTFSNAVATSMLHLLKIGVQQFQYCSATIKFILKMNTIFDIMNTKRVDAEQNFKSALNADNASEIFSFFDDMIPYLKSLKFKTKSCIDSKRKTGFLGFLINMHSVKQMYNDYVCSGLLSCLALFYHSQDTLETFFGRIRSLLGANDNPTLQQFQSAIRKLLFLNEVKASEFANCEDSLDILTVSSKRHALVTQNIHDNCEGSNEIDEDAENDVAISVANEMIREMEMNQNVALVNAELKSPEDSSIAFLAGAIEKKIEKCGFNCVFCMDVFRENEKIDGMFFDNMTTQIPCKSTYLICKYAHMHFDKYKDSKDFNYNIILASIKNSLVNENLFAHSFDHNEGYFHKKQYIETIIDEYIRLYGAYIARCLTLEQQQKLLRSQNKRNVIFLGQ